MRDAFIRAIYSETKKNRNVLCLVGDIGQFLLRDYIRDFPGNFYNLGAAEGNMMGVASGLALSGKIPFVYTITPFATSRAYEQVKDDVCYNGANVKIVGIGSGISYGTMGSTHHSLEDLAIMRVLPGMTILAPGDPQEVEEAMMAAVRIRGPVYIRLTLVSKPLSYDRGTFKVGKARIVKKGLDAAIITFGDTVPVALEAADMLVTQKIESYVINMHTIKPLDTNLIGKLASTCKAIVSLEEHSAVGGLGSAIAEVLAQNNTNKTKFKILGFADVFSKEYSKDKRKLLEAYGMSSNHVATEIKKLCQL